MKNLGKDKLIKIAIGIIAAVVVIIIILLLFHALMGKKKNSYAKIEDKILKAAQKYYSENENLLPQKENEQITIDDVSLTSLGYLDNMADMLKDMENVTCSAKVIISYNNNDYRYTPMLDCGDAYKTQTLASYLEKNEPRVYSGDGLYDLNGEYVYRGENPNNYVMFSDHWYRIVKISDGKIGMIYDDNYYRFPWDDRYNIDVDQTTGINDYTISRMYPLLLGIYENTVDDIYQIFDEYDKELISLHDLYIGRRYDNDNYNDGSIEKSEIVENEYIGLLPLYDYINASIDNNCNSAETYSCANYNYLNHYTVPWWTLTANAGNTFKVFTINADGAIFSKKAIETANVRPVIYLVNDAIYVSGDGTYDNPYIVK